MITWGRLTDLVKNGRGLTMSSILFFVFSNKDIQLFAIELNTGDPNIPDRGQLFLNGEDSRGVPLDSIGGDYAPPTVALKQFAGLPVDRVTLYQEGDFYKSWQFVQKGDEFILRADTIKEGDDLQLRWGTDIVGLTNESINALIQEVLPLVIAEVRRSLLQ